MPHVRRLLAVIVLAPLTLAAAQQPAPHAPARSSQGGDTATTVTVRWVHLQPDRDPKVGILQSIQAQIAKAQAEGRTPFLEVGATWCGPCRALEASLTRSDVVDAFTGAYIIHIQIDDWTTPEQAQGYGKGIAGGIGGTMPVVIALTTEGQPSAKLEEAWNNGNPERIKKFIQAHTWKAAAPAASNSSKPSGR